MRPFSHVIQADKEFGFLPVQAHTLFCQTLLWLTTEGVTQMNHELLPVAIMLGFFPHCKPNLLSVLSQSQGDRRWLLVPQNPMHLSSTWAPVTRWSH